MGLRSIWKMKRDTATMSTRQLLNRDAISALYWIILTALLGIIVLSAFGGALRYGLFGVDVDERGFSNADEALSILGNIGAAAIGGLVGWLTRDQLEARETGYQSLPPEPSEEEAAMPLRIEDTATSSTGIPVVSENLTQPGDVSKNPEKPNTLDDDAVGAPDHDDELDTEEDPDLVWPDEPVDEDEEEA